MRDRDKEGFRRRPRALVRDLYLWHEVARSVTPMNRHQPVLEPSTGRQVEKPAPQQPANRKSSAIAMAAAARSAQPDRPSAKPLSGLDRRTSRRLGRGQLDTDARIDLHGETLETGRGRLLGFLRSARARGDRLVLVITGKGKSPFAAHTLHGLDHFHAPEREGRLRRAFTHWLDEPVFRELVSGYQPAHPKHGGGGAFYVRLRRPERSGGVP